MGNENKDEKPYKILFKNEKSDYISIAFFHKVGDKENVVLTSTKEGLDTDEIYNIAIFMIKFQMVKPDFNVYKIYINSINRVVYDNMKDKEIK